jgi:hypothetical protein
LVVCLTRVGVAAVVADGVGQLRERCR